MGKRGRGEECERERERERERKRENEREKNEGKLAAPYQRKGRMFSNNTIPKIKFSSCTCTESYQIAAIFRKGSF